MTGRRTAGTLAPHGTDSRYTNHLSPCHCPFCTFGHAAYVAGRRCGLFLNRDEQQQAAADRMISVATALRFYLEDEPMHVELQRRRAERDAIREAARAEARAAQEDLRRERARLRAAAEERRAQRDASAVVVELPRRPPRAGWEDDALCRTLKLGIFYPTTAAETAIARRYCEACPVTADCLETALAIEPRVEDDGFRGGMSARQRRRLHQERLREAAVG